MKRIALAVLALLSCSDPVHDQRVKVLGSELSNVPTGEFHRAGQPCADCHGGSGPAGGEAFSVAGTVFAQQGPAVGVDQATVAFVDSEGSTFLATTNCVGNFFVKKSEWDPHFPILVRVYLQNRARTMQGQIGREASCAHCHRDATTATDKLSSVGHVYLFPEGESYTPSKDCPVNPTLGGAQ